MTQFRRIGWGTAQLGFDYGIQNTIGKTSTNEAQEIYRRLMKHSSGTIDTSSVYGDSEKVLGEIISRNHSNKIISKYKDLDNNPLDSQLTNSLNHLGCTSLYAVLSHDPSEIILNKNIWDQFLVEKQNRRVGKVGFSIYETDQFYKILDQGISFDIIQVPYNFFDKRFEKIILKAKNYGMEVHVRSVFLQGLFFKDVKNLPEFFDPLKKEIIKLQNSFGIDLPAFLVNHVLTNKNIDCAIIGFNTLQQLNYLLSGLEGELKSNHQCTTYFESTLIDPTKWKL